MKPALIIVDMQEDFTASHCPKTIRAIVKLIKQFKAKSLPIIVVEYDVECHGETIEPVSEHIRYYKPLIYVEKWTDGGADEIIRESESAGIDFDSCVVCGVNFDCCVFETSYGLSSYHGKIVTLAEAACNTPWKTYNQWVDFRSNHFEPWANIKPDGRLKQRLAERNEW